MGSLGLWCKLSCKRQREQSPVVDRLAWCPGQVVKGGRHEIYLYTHHDIWFLLDNCWSLLWRQMKWSWLSISSCWHITQLGHSQLNPSWHRVAVTIISRSRKFSSLCSELAKPFLPSLHIILGIMWQVVDYVACNLFGLLQDSLLAFALSQQTWCNQYSCVLSQGQGTGWCKAGSDASTPNSWFRLGYMEGQTGVIDITSKNKPLLLGTGIKLPHWFGRQGLLATYCILIRSE